jgi:hypothetical protein
MRRYELPARAWRASLRPSSGRCCLLRTSRTSRPAAIHPKTLHAYAESFAEGQVGADRGVGGANLGRIGRGRPKARPRDEYGAAPFDGELRF